MRCAIRLTHMAVVHEPARLDLHLVEVGTPNATLGIETSPQVLQTARGAVITITNPAGGHHDRELRGHSRAKLPPAGVPMRGATKGAPPTLVDLPTHLMVRGGGTNVFHASAATHQIALLIDVTGHSRPLSSVTDPDPDHLLSRHPLDASVEKESAANRSKICGMHPMHPQHIPHGIAAPMRGGRLEGGSEAEPMGGDLDPNMMHLIRRMGAEVAMNPPKTCGGALPTGKGPIRRHLTAKEQQRSPLRVIQFLVAVSMPTHLGGLLAGPWAGSYDDQRAWLSRR